MSRSSQARDVLEALHTIAVGDRVLVATENGQEHGFVIGVWNGLIDGQADLDVKVDGRPFPFIRFRHQVLYDPE